MTKIEIIHETVEYYKNNPRSLSEDGESCVYIGPNGEKCAFSRCCEKGVTFWEGCGVKDQGNLEEILQPKYKGHSIHFWQEIQDLHDKDYHWEDNNQLTEMGENYYQHLLNKYKDENINLGLQ